MIFDVRRISTRNTNEFGRKAYLSDDNNSHQYITELLLAKCEEEEEGVGIGGESGGENRSMKLGKEAMKKEIPS